MIVEIVKFNDVLKYQLWESWTTLNNNGKPTLEVQKIRHKKASSSEQDRGLLKEGNWGSESSLRRVLECGAHMHAHTYVHMCICDISEDPELSSPLISVTKSPSKQKRQKWATHQPNLYKEIQRLCLK